MSVGPYEFDRKSSFADLGITTFAVSILEASSAAAIRTALGATTVGGNLFTLSDPSAITFPRINADNTVTALSASDFRTAIGAGTVNSVAIDSSILSVSGSPVTDSGTITLGLATSGSGTTLALVNSPAFTTPTLGVATATSVNKVAITAPASNATLTLADGKTLSVSTDVSVSALAGSGSTLALSVSPSFTTPALGTPSAGTLTNCSGLPITGTTFTATSRLAGRATSGAGAGEEIAIGTGLSLSGTTLTATGGSGTVTSVAITGPSIFSWSGSPITSSGTLTGTLANQNANTVLAGPSSGSAAAPTFRSLVHLDLPQLALVNDCRLTLTTGTPAPTVDVATATTIYFTNYTGELVSIPDGTNWQLYRVTSELSLALGTLTSGKNYDVFLWNNSGTLTLAIGTAWSSNTARVSGSAGEIEQYNGWWTNKYAEGSMGARRGRLLGTFRTISTTQTIDSCAGRKRFLCNAQNRVPRPVLAADTTDSWTYTTNTLRQANAAATNQVEYVETLAGFPVEATVFAQCFNATACRALVDIGVDSTTAGSAQLLNGGGSLPLNSFQGLQAKYLGFPGIGYHYLAWLEQSQATGTMNWYGDDGSGTPPSAKSGILAQVWA